MSRDDFELDPPNNWRGSTGLRVPFYKRGWFGALIALVVVGAVAAFVAFSVIVSPLRARAETFDLAELRKLESASIIFDRNGEELSRLYMLNRTPVKLGEMPQHLIDALVSQEDSRFFEHSGVDYIGLIRAVFEALKAGEVNQGASTITQQLARNTFNLTERSYKRKILEMYTALRVEKNFSKPQILELYMNRIYFGGGFYGVQAAATGYFGKDTKSLTVEEAATICALIKSPNNIQPLRHPDRALKERNWVLERMRIEGYLSKEETSRLQKLPMITAPQEGDARLSYIFDEVRREVVGLVGEERASVGGFQIYTSIDKSLQRTAEQSLQNRLSQVEAKEGYAHPTYEAYQKLIRDYRQKLKDGVISPTQPRPEPEYLQGAVLSVDNATGAILAMVGGRDFVDSQYNRALYSRRPSGTAFLPFVYAAAFSTQDLFPGSAVEDAPLDNRRVMIGGLTGILGEWGTEAETEWSMSTITLREALSRSRNAATVRLGDELGEAYRPKLPEDKQKVQSWEAGLEAVRKVVTAAGIVSPLREYPSTFLGASEVKLDEMVLAYSAFPNGGLRPKNLHLVQRIADAQGNVVFQVADADRAPVIAMDTVAAYQVHSCLDDALHRGTGKLSVEQYGLGDYPCAGKTGTHYEFKDLWFVGYSPGVTTGVWVGFDKQKTIYNGAFSSQIALPIWVDTMNEAAPRYAGAEIAPPPGVERVELCRTSGMRATDFCCEKVDAGSGRQHTIRTTYSEYVRPGTRFDSYCTVHQSEGVAYDIASFSRVGLGSVGSGPQVGDLGRFSHVAPVVLQGLTVLGTDPYNAVQTPVRAAASEPDGETKVLKAEVVEPLEEEASDLPIRLSPPPRLFIEDDRSGDTL